MNETMRLFLFALGGLMLGSFVNVLIYRLPRMIMDEACSLSLSWPGSHCPECQHPIAWYHNIPVLSFLWLRARCAHCSRGISWRYPLIELLTTLIWLACASHWSTTEQALIWSIFLTGLFALSVIDWQTTLLPDQLTQGLVWSGLLASALGWLPITAEQSIGGAAAGYGSLWLLARTFTLLTQREGMGEGDFKLLAGMGAWLGWMVLPWIALGASVMGLLMALALMSLGRMKRHDYLPFGPMMSVSAALIAWFGSDVIWRYFFLA